MFLTRIQGITTNKGASIYEDINNEKPCRRRIAWEETPTNATMGEAKLERCRLITYSQILGNE